MDIEKTNKTKTYFVIIVFIMIILLSAYVVVDKILDRNKQDEAIAENEQELLENSKVVTELSPENKKVKIIYKFVNDEEIDYILYQNKGSKLSWDTKSLLVVKNLQEFNEKDSTDIINIDKEIFEEKYIQIFGDNLNKEIRYSTKCPTTTYNIEEGLYSINLNCYEKQNNIQYKTFLKNIILEDDAVIINKYYVFLREDETTLEKDYSLYKTNNLNKENLIVNNTSYDQINNYIYNMNIVSYIYKKDLKGNYYLSNVK